MSEAPARRGPHVALPGVPNEGWELAAGPAPDELGALTGATATTPVVLSPYSQSALGCRLSSGIGVGAGVPQRWRVRPGEMTGREGGAMAEESDRGAMRPVR
jgi:hypothetical protein